MLNTNSTELASAKNKAISYLEKSVYTLSVLLGLDPDSVSSSTVKPDSITEANEVLAFESLINQVTILEGLKA